MINKFFGLAVAFTVSVGTFAGPALAAGEGPSPPRESWTFSGPFGYFDNAQLQRGFKVWREACSACHKMKYLSFRNLSQPGGPEFTEDQVKALAAEYTVQDGPNDAGEMFERPGRPADHIPWPFANDQIARAANNGALPPDMSMLAKARSYTVGLPWFPLDFFRQYEEDGVDYIHALISYGYEAPVPDHVKVPDGAYFNLYKPGYVIAMGKPLSDGQVEYTDGTPTTVDQYSRDVAAFLMWAAEPHLEARKEMGFKVMVFLIVFAGLLYFTKKKVWSSVHA